jgi:hypothetical protein
VTHDEETHNFLGTGDAISRESLGVSEEFFDDFDEPYCYECDGKGYKIVCPDDLCHGQDECIHGDEPVLCRACGGRNAI